MKENSRKKYLIKNTLVFALSALATKLITFFLVPIYTNALNPDEFGIVDLLFTICSFLVPVFTLNITEAIYRFSLDKDHKDNEISSIAIVCFLLAVVLGVITIPIFNSIDGYKNYSVLFYLYLISNSLSQILLVNLKGHEKLKLYSAGNIINTLSIALFNIVFLIVFKMGIKGYFMAYILSNIITVVYGIISNNIFKELKKFKFNKVLFKKMTKYSIVLIPTSFMWWIINSSDRIMITSFVSSYANGIYAVSYKIPSLLTVIASIFNQAWIFSAIKEKDSEDNEKYTNKMFNMYFSILCIISILILIIIKPLFKIYVASKYYTAWEYVPFLIFGFIFMNLGSFISTSYNVQKDSKGFLASGTIGAIANIALNFAFIPFMGTYGAALATMISYIVVFIYRLIDTRKYLKIHISIEKIRLLLLVLVACALTYLDYIYGIIGQALILVLSIILYRRDWQPIIATVLNRIKKR